jgi:hypothetical protein
MVIVKPKGPAAVGVPYSREYCVVEGSSVRPGGSVPAVMDQLYGPFLSML